MGPKKTPWFRIFCYVVVICALVIYLVPLFFALNISLMPKAVFAKSSLNLTHEWAFSNYLTAWERASFEKYVFNSVLYTVVCTMLSLLLSLFIAFPISRKYIPYPKFWYYLFICGMFLPNGMIPLFQLILNMNLYNTRPGYMLVMTGVSATSVFFFTGYLNSIPKEMDEAASIDGCGYGRYMLTTIIPLSQPAMMSMGILTMIGVWNDIISSTIYLQDEAVRTITRGLYVFTGQFQNDWTLMAAALFIVAFPLIVVYIFGQRFIVDGIMAGGLKA